jgi:cytosine/adenosine deaminase-related metal-dependent hydrolase
MNTNTATSPAASSDLAREVTIYSAKLVIPVTGPVIVDGAVAVHGDRVMHVGRRRWVLDAVNQESTADAAISEWHWDGVLMPGLINAHTHLQYTGMESVGAGTYEHFHDWELAFNKVYALAKDNQPWKPWAYRGARMLVEAGTTAAADIVTDLQASDALGSQGLHGISYWEVMGWHNAEWQAKGRLELRRQLREMSRRRLPSLGISPHAPYTLESEPFIDLPDIARQLNMRLHIHLAETPLEAGSYPPVLTTYSGDDWNHEMWDSYRQLKASGKGASAIQFVDQLGSLGPDVHIAHGVWADKEDRRILRQRGVGVALCPRSNRITNTGKDAPVREYLEEGNLLSVGTDSLSSSPSLDVLDDVAMLYDLAREQGYTGDDLTHRLIRMMTLGGAEAMGMHVGVNRIGQINAGALADLAFFDIPTVTSSPANIEETIETLVRHGAGSNRATVLSGRLVYNNGAFGNNVGNGSNSISGSANEAAGIGTTPAATATTLPKEPQ